MSYFEMHYVEGGRLKMFKHASEISQAELIERWENAERVLVNMPEHERKEHWCMANWGRKTACGTVACAAGHCGLDPWFIKQGLELVLCDCESCVSREAVYAFRGDSTTVKAFFGKDGAGKIFYDRTLRSVETVIEEIRAHISELRE